MDLSGFFPLYGKALDDAVRYIEAARGYVNGKISETQLRAVIGSRSYIEG